MSQARGVSADTDERGSATGALPPRAQRGGEDDDLTILYLAAQAVRGLGVRRLKRLVDELGTLRRVTDLPISELRRHLPGAPAVAERLALELGGHARRAARRLPQLRSAGLEVVNWEAAAYPRPLRDDPVGAAPLLFVEGVLPPQLDFPSSGVRACAVVGTRTPSHGGRSFARDLGLTLAREGVLVVSGLALGIDGAAHEGALEAVEGARSAPGSRAASPRYRWADAATPTPRPAGTVAVLGGGHGHLHPASHRPLARRILAAGGAILSLWEPDVTPDRGHFPRRNRVVSGLSRVVAVIEARERSGTNSTVEHALDQGRTVMAVPGAPWTATGVGGLKLLQEGALLLGDAADVLGQFKELLPLPEGRSAPDAAPSAGGPTSAEGRLRHVLAEGGELSLDALEAHVELPRGALLALLSRLELRGEVEATDGGRYRWRG